MAESDARKPPLRFLFDYVNPYAYIAWTQIHALAGRHGREVEPVPILYAALLKAHGTREADEVRAWRRYMFKDVLRTAEMLGILIIPPVRDPIQPLLALRASSLPMEAADRRRLVDELFAEAWAGGRDISEPEEVATVASSVGLNGPALVADAQKEEAKALLRTRTAEALAAGVFSVPTLQVGGELFWRYESFPHLERFLDGKDPINPARVERWAQLLEDAARGQTP